MYEEELDFCSSICIDLEIYYYRRHSVSYEWKLLSFGIFQRQHGCYDAIYYFFNNLLSLEKAT